MNIARLNFSHGDFKSHKKVIEGLRAAAEPEREDVWPLWRSPGAKNRIGQIAKEPIQLKVAGNTFTLTMEQIAGDVNRVFCYL